MPMVGVPTTGGVGVMGCDGWTTGGAGLLAPCRAEATTPRAAAPPTVAARTSHFFRAPEDGGREGAADAGSCPGRMLISTGISNSALSPSNAADTANNRRPGWSFQTTPITVARPLAGVTTVSEDRPLAKCPEGPSAGRRKRTVTPLTGRPASSSATTVILRGEGTLGVTTIPSPSTA